MAKSNYCADSKKCRTCIHLCSLKNSGVDEALPSGNVFCAFILDTGYSRSLHFKGAGDTCEAWSAGEPLDRRNAIIVKDDNEYAQREKPLFSKQDLKWLAGLLKEDSEWRLSKTTLLSVPLRHPATRNG